MKKRLENSEIMASSKDLETFIREILQGRSNSEVNRVIKM